MWDTHCNPMQHQSTHYRYSNCSSEIVFFFFTRKTAYEVKYGLVGSEVCIRDRGARLVDTKALHEALHGILSAITFALA